MCCLADALRVKEARLSFNQALNHADIVNAINKANSRPVVETRDEVLG